MALQKTKSETLPTRQAMRDADRFIALLNRFKKGAKIQKKGRYTDGWVDIDLADYISKSAVHYRVKPQ